jgi:hypothetical protein
MPRGSNTRVTRSSEPRRPLPRRRPAPLAAQEPPAGRGLAGLGRLIGGVLAAAPVAGLAASLFAYFTWVRDRALSSYFGIPVDLLPAPDRNVSSQTALAVFYYPIVVVLIVGIGGLWLTARLLTLVRHGRFLGPLKITGKILSAAWVIGVMAVPALRADHTLAQRLTPLIIILSVLLTAGGLYLSEQVAFKQGQAVETPAWQKSGVLSVALIVTVLSLFWEAGLYAQSNGIRTAETIYRNLDSLPGAVVYSKERLTINGPGVEVAQIFGQAGYNYRYTGLAVLSSSTTRYLLIPEGSTPYSSSIINLTITDSMRVDFIAQ